MPGGRRLDPVWIDYVRDVSNPKNIKAKCKFCDVSFQAVLERMHKHSQMCVENPKNEEKKRSISQLSFYFYFSLFCADFTGFKFMAPVQSIKAKRVWAESNQCTKFLIYFFLIIDLGKSL